MRVLLLHTEPRYFGGAEKMLGYFLDGYGEAASELALGAAPGSACADLAAGVERVLLKDDRRFSILRLLRNTAVIQKINRRQPFQVLHGWAARDWELTALASYFCRCPAIGTLHDHPDASFISAGRRQIMRFSARVLRKIVCVSEAVRAAAADCGYPEQKLMVIQNGLPARMATATERKPGIRRLGFLGVFLERKGFRGFFETIDELSKLNPDGWEVAIGGVAQDAESERMVQQVRAEYQTRSWWARVTWCGWVKKPVDFLKTIDLLVFPSRDFDPFPTVLLEAGLAGVPVVGARLGGVPEIIDDGRTGWLFAPGDWLEAARQIGSVMENDGQLALAGAAAAERINSQFPVLKMVARYRELYSTFASHG